MVAQEIRHGDPEQSGHDQQVGEDRHEEPGGLGPEKGGIKQRLGGEQEENTERACRQKFVHEPQHQKKADRQKDKKRFPKT